MEHVFFFSNESLIIILVLELQKSIWVLGCYWPEKNWNKEPFKMQSDMDEF